MQLVYFPTDIYDEGVVKFEQGSYHALNSETQSLIDHGYADLVADDPHTDHFAVLQATARIATERADAAMAAALALAEEADIASAMAHAAAPQGSNDSNEKKVTAPQ